MKILLVNRLFGIRKGGGEWFDYYIAKTLKEMGCDVKLICGKKMLDKDKNKNDETNNNLDIIYLKTPYMRDFSYKYENNKFILLRKLAGRILDFDLYLFEKKVLQYLYNKKEKFDIVELCGLPRLGAWIEKNFGIRTVIEWHGIPSVKYIKWAKKCWGHIAIGPTTFAAVKNMISDRCVQVFPGVDSNFFFRIKDPKVRNLFNIPQNAVVYIFVGRLIPIKNIIFMLSGFHEALKNNKNIYLIIGGEGPEMSNIKAYIKKYKLYQNIKLAGWVGRDKIVEYYSDSDVFIITSHYESFPLVVLEAMSCALPVIATKVGALPSLVKDKNNGLLIEKNNVDQLKDAILFFASNEKLRKEIGRNNRDEIINCYSWQKTVQTILNYMNMI